MEPPQVFDDAVKSEKQRALARYNLVRTIVKLRQVLEFFVVCAVISWSSVRVPKFYGGACACFARLYGFVFNPHVVFVIGNAIIVVLCVLCRRSDVRDGGVGDDDDGERDFYDDYVKHSESILRREEAAPAKTGGDGVAGSVTRYEESVSEALVPIGGDVAPAVEDINRRNELAIAVSPNDDVSPCDDVAEAIERASRQIKRFEMTQSETLRRAIAPARRSLELRRSETDIGRKIPPASEIESLDGEEFRLAIDAFIDEHWNRKGAKQSREYEGDYQLVKVT